MQQIQKTVEKPAEQPVDLDGNVITWQTHFGTYRKLFDGRRAARRYLRSIGVKR